MYRPVRAILVVPPCQWKHQTKNKMNLTGPARALKNELECVYWWRCLTNAKVCVVNLTATFSNTWMHLHMNTLIKKKTKFSSYTYKEIQIGSSAKSYMRKGFLQYEEMRKFFTIYEEAVSHIWLCTRYPSNFLIYEKKCFLFYQCSAVCTVLYTRYIEYIIIPRDLTFKNQIVEQVK